MGAREACCSSEKVAGEVKSPLCPDKRFVVILVIMVQVYRNNGV